MDTPQLPYGEDDTSYRAAGELAGIRQLVSDFYDQMDQLSEARRIREMHPTDLDESKQKLTYFLSGWLGGPRLYQQHYGTIRIPMFHQHLAIAEEEKEAWLRCMRTAIEAQPYAASFKSYLIAQLRVPAERIVQAVRQRSG